MAPVLTVKKLTIKAGQRVLGTIELKTPFTLSNQDNGYGRSFKEEGLSEFITGSVGEKSSFLGGKKRGSTDISEDQPRKKARMDSDMAKECSALLEKLIEHRYGWVFSQPVDYKSLNLADYLSVVTKPMDLGTIKSKLEKGLYLGKQDFSADLRLTFSNAMSYTPPSSWIHKMALELKEVFEEKWKSIEENWDANGYPARAAKVPTEKVRAAPKEKLKRPPRRHTFVPKEEISVKDACVSTEEKPGVLCQCGSLCSSVICNRRLSRDSKHKSSSEAILEGSQSDKGAISSPDAKPSTSSRPKVHVTDSSSSKGCRNQTSDLEKSSIPRAALLKNRFSDAIYRAQEKLHLDHGKNAAQERLEKEKRRRERERKAARIAVEKMEADTEIVGDNLKYQMELEKLCGNSLSHGGARLLETFGLFLKDDHMAEDPEDEVSLGDIEEGEIVKEAKDTVLHEDIEEGEITE